MSFAAWDCLGTAAQNSITNQMENKASDSRLDLITEDVGLNFFLDVKAKF